MPIQRLVRKISALVLTFGVAASPQLVFAQYAAKTPGAEPSKWGLGIAVTSMDRPYTDAGYETIPFPVLSYEGKYFRFSGNTADVKYETPGQAWTLALRGRYSLGGGYEADDAPILRGMEKRKDKFWAGGVVSWNAEFARISLEALADVSGESKGVQGKLGIERDFRAGSFTFTPHAAAQYLDKKYVSYYYGVNASEVTSFRPKYDGSGTVNFQFGVRTAYSFNSNHSLFLDVSATALGKEIKNSPLVDKSIVPTFTAGYLYRF